MTKRQKKRTEGKGSLSFWIFCQSLYRDKGPLVRFALKFVAILSCYYVASLTQAFQNFLSFAINIDAHLADAVINCIGEKSYVLQTTIWSTKGAVLTVLPECTSIEFSWILAAAIFAFPAPINRQFLGALIGISFVLSLNILRIVSLYLTGVYHPYLFDLIHEQIWPIIYDIVLVSLLIAWIFWTIHRSRRVSNA